MSREQINIKLIELNKLIDFLTERTKPEGVYVGRNYVNDVTSIAFELKELAPKDVSDIVIKRAHEERKASNKILFLYIIDSLIKRLGGKYCDFIIPYLFRIFEDTFMASNDQEKIQLFKLYYAWKYFIDQTILSQMNIRFNLNELKEYLLRTEPGIIAKYDQYNESERIRRDQITRGVSNMQESLLGQLGVEQRYVEI
jgi:hypothetical protein